MLGHRQLDAESLNVVHERVGCPVVAASRVSDQQEAERREGRKDGGENKARSIIEDIR
jgi:hypothetical protein